MLKCRPMTKHSHVLQSVMVYTTFMIYR